jgi:hypothetical protein
MTDFVNETIISAFSQTHAGFSEVNTSIRHYSGGAFTARGEHEGVSIDVNRTAQGEVRVRYLERDGGHAYAVHAAAGMSVQVLDGQTESDRLHARNAAFALAGRIGRALPAPGIRPSAGPP